MVSMDLTYSRPVKIILKSAAMGRLRALNAVSKKSIVGKAPITLSLTSYADRLKTVWYTIESLAQGSVLPARFILWVDEEDFSVDNYPELKRLQNRGLEIRFTKNYGPHKKAYPYCLETGGEENLLVTADDDILYPKNWLRYLNEAAAQYPGEFLGYRTHRFTLDAQGKVAPYKQWVYGSVNDALYSNFITTGAGTIFPAALQKALKEAGEDFLEKSPKADDIWVNVIALRNGLKARKIDHRGMTFISIPRTQKNALHHQNVAENLNDKQLAASITQHEIDLIAQDAPRVSEN
ncbi:MULTISPECIES: glycosyltransferase family A protein [Rothia]|uniref:glycosyltransferase family A protein n=1 Tax=Rothia TaxID=32207 RepID=UPI001F433B0C|nr:glycosyltransferase family A protein [Rothia nasimurium]